MNINRKIEYAILCKAKKSFFPFEDVDNRTFWDYIPLARQGLPLGEMDKHQRQFIEDRR